MAVKSKNAEIVLECEQTTVPRLQLWKEGLFTSFCSKRLEDLWSGTTACNKIFPEPKMEYKLKYRIGSNETLNGSDSPDNLSYSSIYGGLITPVKSTPVKVVSPGSKGTVRSPVKLNEHGGDVVEGWPSIHDCPVEEDDFILLVDESVYFARLNECKRERRAQQEAQRVHDERVAKGMKIIRDQCSIDLIRALQDEFNSCLIPNIISAVERLCGPGDSDVVIERLETEWLTTRKTPAETIQTVVLRVDTLARDLNTFGISHRKNDKDKVAAINRVLSVDADYKSVWLHLCKDAKKHNTSWKDFKDQLYEYANTIEVSKSTTSSKKQSGSAKGDEDLTLQQKALLADPEVLKLINRAKGKSPDNKKKPEKDKKKDVVPEKKTETTESAKPAKLPFAEWVKLQDCRNCGKKGHLQKDCTEPKKEGSNAVVEEARDEEGDEEEDEIDAACWECNPAEPLYGEHVTALAVRDTVNSNDDIVEITDDCVVGSVNHVIDSREIIHITPHHTKYTFPAISESVCAVATFILNIPCESRNCQFVSVDDMSFAEQDRVEAEVEVMFTFLPELVPMQHSVVFTPSISCVVSETFATSTAAVSAPVQKKRIIDSGTTSHVVADLVNRMSQFTPRSEPIGLADTSKKVMSKGRGTLGICSDCLWAPEMSYTLISPGKFDLEGMYTVFGGGKGIVISGVGAEILRTLLELVDDSVVMRSALTNGLYELTEDDSMSCVSAVASHTSSKPFTFVADKDSIKGTFGVTRPGSTGGLNPLEVLHFRCGHVSERTLKHALKHNAIHGAQTTYEACKNLTIRFCAACQMGQMTAKSIPRGLADHSEKRPFEIIGIDPVPMSTLTYHGNKYVNFGVCLITNFLFTYESRSNGCQREMIQCIQRDYCSPYGHTIKKVCTDHHSVFLSKEVQEYLLQEKIEYESSPPYEHQRNVVEGAAVRPLLDKARVMLLDAKFSPAMAGFALRAAVKTFNMLPHPVGSLLSPYEKVTGQKPDVSILRPFGVPVLYHQYKEERSLLSDPRWAERACNGVLVGYSDIVRGAYLIMNSKRKIITRKQVLALEFKPEEVQSVYHGAFMPGDALTERASLEIEVPPEPPRAAPKSRIDPPVTRGASKRAAVPTPASHAAIDATVHAVCMCKAQLDDMCHQSCLVDICSLPPSPRSIAEAERGPHAQQWAESIARERAVMLDPDHPKYVEYDGTPARAMRAVLAMRASHLPDNEIKFKSRLCPNGSTQVKGIDFSESYSPTARRQLIYIVLHIVGVKDYEARQFDVGAAYLEVPARHDQYMRMSDDLIRLGFSTTRYVKLLVNFYGTHDAGRNWYEYFVHLLLSFGLNQSKEDPCLFTLVEGVGVMQKMLIVLLFVDDGAYAGNWVDKMRELEVFLRDKVNKITFKEIDKFVGLSVRRDRPNRKVYVSVHEYAHDITEKYKFPGSTKPADTPLPLTLQYREMSGTESPVWGITGALLYLSETTWPDLKVAASLLASGGATPHINHTKGAKQALRYVHSHAEGRELVLGGTDPVTLLAYSDASYDPAGDSKYQFGYAEALSEHSGCFNIVSKRAKTVSHSSLQSEMRAITEVCKEVCADRNLLAELGCPQEKPTCIYTDSQCAIDLVTNHYGYHPKCRHFNRDTNYVRECVINDVIELLKIDGVDNPADATTKLCVRELLDKHTRALLSGLTGEENKEASDNV